MKTKLQEIKAIIHSHSTWEEHEALEKLNMLQADVSMIIDNILDHNDPNYKEATVVKEMVEERINFLMDEGTIR